MQCTSEAPTCPGCNALARLTNGAEIYPHRPEFADKPIWKCDGCGGYVGCHPGTTDALGTPAGPELRAARSKLHDRMINPLWLNAHLAACYRDKRQTYRVRKTARERVYEFLADRLGIAGDECHAGMFDLETCRHAWVALRGVTYVEIRAWAHRRRREAA